MSFWIIFYLKVMESKTKLKGCVARLSLRIYKPFRTKRFGLKLLSKTYQTAQTPHKSSQSWLLFPLKNANKNSLKYRSMRNGLISLKSYRICLPKWTHLLPSPIHQILNEKDLKNVKIVNMISKLSCCNICCFRCLYVWFFLWFILISWF